MMRRWHPCTLCLTLWITAAAMLCLSLLLWGTGR
jgi:hypothetical protein